MEWIFPIITLASLAVAVLTSINKLMWAKEFREAKQETIRAKEAQIDLLKNEIQNLRELNPVTIREHFKSVKEQLEERIQSLKEQFDQAQAEITQKDVEINRYRSDSASPVEMEKLKTEKLMLEDEAAFLKHQLKKMRDNADRSEELLESNLITLRGVPGDKPSDIVRYLAAELPPEIRSQLSDNTLYEIACVLFYGTKTEAIYMLTETTKVNLKDAKDLLTRVNVTRFRNELLRSDRGSL
jgi:chromosome segregation ATPase